MISFVGDVYTVEPIFCTCPLFCEFHFTKIMDREYSLVTVLTYLIQPNTRLTKKSYFMPQT